MDVVTIIALVLNLSAPSVGIDEPVFFSPFDTMDECEETLVIQFDQWMNHPGRPDDGRVGAMCIELDMYAGPTGDPT